jgi:hypothetical protein
MNMLIHRAIMTRPYSWLGIIMLAVLSNVLARGSLVTDLTLALDVFTAMVIWYSATSMLETLHGKIDGRGLTNPLNAAISFIILAAIMIFRNPITLVFIPVILIADFLYSMKVKSPSLGHISFILRGILELSVVMIILLLNMNYDFLTLLPIILTAFLLTDSRNLIGDIRDVEFDKYTFPRKYGVRAGYAVSVLLILMGFLLIPNPLIMLPVLFIIPTFLVIRNAYMEHRIFVVGTTFFYANYVIFTLGQDLLLSNLLFIAVLLNFTYPIIPRKSNPFGVKFYSYER